MGYFVVDHPPFQLQVLTSVSKFFLRRMKRSKCIKENIPQDIDGNTIVAQRTKE